MLSRLVVVLAVCSCAIAPAGVPQRAASVPSFARNQRPTGDHPEGHHLEALPAIAYDRSLGLQLGAVAYYALDGRKDDALFAVTPYRHRFFAQAIISTLGYQQYILSYDGIYLGDSPYRLRAGLMFERNTNANYFGIGERAMGPLVFDGIAHPTFDEQTAAASAAHDGVASPLYHHYAYVKPSAAPTLERIAAGGLVRLALGAVVQHLAISTYDGAATTGRDATGNEVPATHGPTLLGMDCAVGAIRGCGGGWNNMLKAGIAFDTRDFEPDPRDGVFADAVIEWASRAFGSSYDHVRVAVAMRAYWSPLPQLADVVFAARVAYSVQTTHAPFFAQGTLAGTDRDIDGALGGELTLRGYRNNRFSGRVMALANAELRWTLWRFSLRDQRFAVMLTPLVDAGRVFDRVGLSLARWRTDYGGGLRVAWNRSTIVRFDIAASSEDTGVYVGVDLPF